MSLKYIVALVLLVSPAQGASDLKLIGVGGGAAAPAYTGPGDVVSGANGFWGLRAYNAAYATGLNKLANICTPADAVCANVNSDASGNFNLAGTGSLTCNNSGSICTIKTLYDQSGANLCSGACDVTQATIANRPTLIVPGAANGCPTTSHFCMSTSAAATQMLVAITNLAVSLAQPYTFSFVYNALNSNSRQDLVNNNFGTTNISAGFGGVGKLGCGASIEPNVTAADATYHSASCVLNNTTSDILIDGTSNAPLSMGANATNVATWVLLAQSSAGADTFGGFTEEIGYWAIGFSTTQASNMSTNAHTYWGF